MLAALLIAPFVLIGCAWARPNFTSEPKAEPYYVTADSEDLLLPCAVDTSYLESEKHAAYWIRLVGNTPFLVRSDVNYQLDNASCAGCLNLRIRKVNYARDNGKFYCQIATSDGVTYTSKEAHVVVMLRSEPPQLDKVSFLLSQGRREVVKCSSRGGNPAPSITWFWTNGTQASHLATVQNGTGTQAPTVSTFTFTASAEDNGQSLICKVWNVAMGDEPPMEVKTNALVVLYPPKVTVYPNSPYNVEVGGEAKLYCQASGNPMPTLFSWQRTGGVVDSTWVVQNISFSVSREHAGTYKCTVENSEGVEEKELQVAVQYAPEIGVPDELIVKEGEDVHLKCQVDSNPPPYLIVWTGPEMNAANSSVIQLQAVSRHQAGAYTCEAKNRLTLQDANGSTDRFATKSTRLIVSYPPGQAVITVDEPVLVGSTVTLNCSALDAGYPRAKYKWKSPGQTVYQNSGQSVYTLTNIQLSQAGDYWCVPFNDAGNGQEVSYRLVVREPARLVKFMKSEETTREGQTGYFLSCSAVGNPRPSVVWLYDEEPVSRDHYTVIERPGTSACDNPDQCSLKVTSTLQWSSAIRWDNKGVYTCRADNGAGHPSDSTMFLKVQHRPVIINDPLRRTIAADQEDTVHVVCKVTASPEPIFRWYRNGEEVQNFDGSKFDTNQLRNHSFDIYENTLVIRGVSSDDYGAYSCKAANLFGDDNYTFKVERKSKPNAPGDLKVDTQTHTSVQLSWIPGFDGGHVQKFTLEIGHEDRVVNVDRLDSIASAVEWKPSLKVERVLPIRHNVTGLEPSTFYTFRVQANNLLGESSWSPPLTSITKDAPLNTDIKAPDSAVYNSMSQSLEFEPAIDTSLYCVMVYLQKEVGPWERWKCATEMNRVDSVPPAHNLQLRVCNSLSMECSEAVPVKVNVATSTSWEAIVAISCTILLTLLVVTALCLYCRRNSKKFTKPIAFNATTGGQTKDFKKKKKDKREISAPMYTDQILNGSNLGVDRTTASSKDSGVFTTVSNYQMDGYLPEVNGHAYSEGATLPRPISYEEAADHWTISGCRLSQNPNCTDADMAAHVKPPSIYAQDFIDMNPAGGSVSPSRDDSMHSGYSTPLQKRIIREIIV